MVRAPPGQSDALSQTDRTRSSSPATTSRGGSEHDRQGQPWGDLALVVRSLLLLLTIVAYTALHGADVLAELDDLGLVPGAY